MRDATYYRWYNMQISDGRHLSSSKSKKKIERKKELINYENGHRLPYVAENIQTQCQNFHLFESLVECIQYS